LAFNRFIMQCAISLGVAGSELASPAKAGAEKADPLIRYVVDDEFGDVAHKEKSFADKVMFWRGDKKAAATPVAAGADSATPVDAAAEDARIAQLTGGKTVIIQREGQHKIKLPGL